MPWRRARIGLAVLAALGALTIAGRLLDPAALPPPAAPSSAPATSATVPVPLVIVTIPAGGTAGAHDPGARRSPMGTGGAVVRRSVTE
jgi:hypothetical protein